MEIRTLKYFLTVAHEENFTRAAQILYLSQPALSKQLKLLEDELGKKLFIRKNFGIELTDDGKILKNLAEDIVNKFDNLKTEFNSEKNIGGQIYFGMAESAQIDFIAKKFFELKKIYPRIYFRIISGDSEQIITKLETGILDFAVIADKPNFFKFNALEFPKSDEWGLIFRENDKLAEKNFITFDDLKNLQLICSEQAWSREFSEWCGGKISELNLAGTYRLVNNAAIFAKENLGYLLAFNHLVNLSENNLIFRPLYPRLETKLYLIWKKSPKFSPIAEKFLEEIKITFDEIL